MYCCTRRCSEWEASAPVDGRVLLAGHSGHEDGRVHRDACALLQRRVLERVEAHEQVALVEAHLRRLLPVDLYEYIGDERIVQHTR